MRYLLLLVALLALASVAPVGAAPKPPPTLTVSPANPHVGDWLTFSGCGYTPGQGVGLNYHSPAAIGYFSGGTADANGCFTSTTVGLYAQPAGAWDAYSYQTYVGHHQKLLADLDFDVLP